MTIITGGRCECGAPIAAKSHIGRPPIRCENCRRFVSQINTLRGNWRRNAKSRATRKSPMSRADITRRHREKRYREIDEMPKIACACGCGEMIAPINKMLNQASFAHGHNDGSEGTQFKIGENTGASNAKWRGGRTLDISHGYVRVRFGGRNVFEHRHVMSRAIGRSLRRGETVHHRNGIRHDNRLENLELWSTQHPSGVRVFDLISFIVETYPQAVRDELARRGQA